jgi:hypothetical protein
MRMDWSAHGDRLVAADPDQVDDQVAGRVVGGGVEQDPARGFSLRGRDQGGDR